MRLQVAITELIERLGLSDPSQVTKYSVSQRFGVIPSSELENRTMQAKSLENYKIVSQNNLVLNRFNAYKGALGLAPNRGVVSPDYFVAEINERIADPCFIRYFLLSQSSADLIKRDMGGMGSGDPDSSAFSRFDVRSLMSMKIPIVDLHTQSAIADYLHDARGVGRPCHGSAARGASARQYRRFGRSPRRRHRSRSLGRYR